MFLITNRALSNATTMRAFGDTPNPAGPNELRLVEVTPKGKTWSVKQVTDSLTTPEVKQLKANFKLDIDEHKDWHASLEVACTLFKQAQDEGKSILFFVHGYNNDVNDVIRAAEEMEKLYNLIVVPFAWPANGGGVVSGTASYLSDKSDARASSGALNRFVQKVQYFHELLTAASRADIKAKVEEKFEGKDNPMAAAQLYTELVEKTCKVKISLLCHSMGNYLLKHSLQTSDNATSDLVFDNVCLVSADANNKNHAQWVEALDARKRVYIVINEDDSALAASRIKPGSKQGARLGHYLRGLDSKNAVYINLTDVDGVGRGHTYFKGDSVNDNPVLKNLFDKMFNGLVVEKHLRYFSGDNLYMLK